MPSIKGNTALSGLLEKVYKSALADGKSKESAARIAWHVAKGSGWRKVGGKWVKRKGLSRALKGK